MAAVEFQETLNRLGLAQYHDGFVAEAFDSWQVLADITEEDLDALGVKLGHRRVLQRAIAEYQRDGIRSLAVEPRPQAHSGHGTADGYTKTDDKANGVGASHTASAPKRKYRRHPKPDENAPERPPSAYVLFSNQVRENLRDQGQELSFTEIAKAVGERWQVLPHEEKGLFESQSQAGKDRYYSQLAEYKKTKDFSEYQKYLAGFKAKHDGTQDAKRKKGDKPFTLERRDSDDKERSSPGNEAGSTHSSERHHSDIGSPIAATHSEWQTASHAGNNSPRSNHYDVTSTNSSGHSPPLTTTSDFTANQASRSQTQRPQSSPRPSFSHTAGYMNGPLRFEHPMALSTSLAFGFMPPPLSSGNSNHKTYSSHSSVSPPLIVGGPNRDHTRLPPIRRPDLLSSSISPFGGQPVAGEPRQGGMANRHLPPPIPSRLSNSSVNGGHTSPSSDHFPQHSPGIASLLRAGEHLASSEAKSPPTRDGGQVENSVSSTHNTERKES